MKPGSKNYILKLEQQHHRCFYCGDCLHENIIEVDHFIPRSVCKRDCITNFVLCCFDCNRSKGKRSIEEFRIKFAKLFPRKFIRGVFYFEFIRLPIPYLN